MMNEGTSRAWWNNLSDLWKEIIQLNYSGQFEMSEATREKLFKPGINLVDNYKILLIDKLIVPKLK